MRTLILLAVSLAAVDAAAQSLPARYFYENQALTRAAPSGAPGTASNFTLPSTTVVKGSNDSFLGMPLNGVEGFRVSVCAASGQTLTGGTLRAWLYHAPAGLWMRNSDLDRTVANNSQRCQPFPDQATPLRLAHRVLYQAQAVTASGGAAVDIYIDGQLKTASITPLLRPLQLARLLVLRSHWHEPEPLWFRRREDDRRAA